VVEVIETVDNTNKLLAVGAGVVAAGAAAMKLVGGRRGRKGAGIFGGRAVLGSEQRARECL